MTFYVSLRALQMGNKMVTPKEFFKKGFVGINFTSKMVAENRGSDGRLLYEIEIDAGYTQQEKDDYKAMFLEALTMFSVHEKTLQSAEDLAELLTGKDFSQSGDKIVMDNPNPFA